jgi:DnaJ-class molecular chaperone
MFVHLCTDCLEEANLMETIYERPCPHCHGTGREWEGWDCDHCDGSGTDDY